MKGKLILGCIADDFTSGSDASSFMVAGANHFYIKYCSTFDSTPQGNIGSIVDAVLEELGAAGTILCPALPANQRIVKDGILYVKGLPLSQSPMKDHPLTPMWESRISLLMKPQGKYESLELSRAELYEDVQEKISAFTKDKAHWYLIPDYVDDKDAERIVELFGSMTVLTGGSGILTALAQKLKTKDAAQFEYRGTQGKAIIVAGSCSTATRAQTLFYEKQGGKIRYLTDAGILSGEENPQALWSEMKTFDAPLISSYESPEGLMAKCNDEGRALAAKIEKTLAGTAKEAMAHGVTRIISAGGETSGAVTQALGYKAYRIGKSIAPGGPVMTPLENPKIRLVLKSGNFGQEDFFVRALELTEDKDNE